MTRYLFSALLVCAAFSIASFEAPAVAQEWPAGPVNSTSHSEPGSTPDIVARLIADRLAQRLGQPFVVEDKPDASGNLGTDAVA